MHPLKFSYDALGEDGLNALDEISSPMTKELPRNRSRATRNEKDQERQPAPKRDLYAMLRDHSSEDERLRDLWEEVNTVPEWVDWAQISRGQDVFYRYGGAALTAVWLSLRDFFLNHLLHHLLPMVLTHFKACVSIATRWHGSW